MPAAATENVYAPLAPLVPEGVELRVARPGELDGVELAVLHMAEVLPELEARRDLRVVRVLSAGTDWIEDAVPLWVTLCNARGARDIPVAEWVVGALLAGGPACSPARAARPGPTSHRASSTARRC